MTHLVRECVLNLRDCRPLWGLGAMMPTYQGLAPGY